VILSSSKNFWGEIPTTKRSRNT